MCKYTEHRIIADILKELTRKVLDDSNTEFHDWCLGIRPVLGDTGMEFRFAITSAKGSITQMQSVIPITDLMMSNLSVRQWGDILYDRLVWPVLNAPVLAD